MKKSDVRFGNKEGGGTNFGSEERFAWQKSMYASDAMYTMPEVKAPPFSFGTSTRADWKKMMENTKDLYNPNCEVEPSVHNRLRCFGVSGSRLQQCCIDWATAVLRPATIVVADGEF